VHFSVLGSLHSVHCRFWHLLFGWSCSRIHPLWLLHHFVWICLCWKHAWYYLHYFIFNSFYIKQMFSVRNTLVLFSLFSMIASIALIVTSTMLIVALRKVISEFSLVTDVQAILLEYFFLHFRNTKDECCLGFIACLASLCGDFWHSCSLQLLTICTLATTYSCAWLGLSLSLPIAMDGPWSTLYT
jgi:hypothetical protein